MKRPLIFLLFTLLCCLFLQSALAGQYGTVNHNGVRFRRQAESTDVWAMLDAGWQVEILNTKKVDGVKYYYVVCGTPKNPGRQYWGYIQQEYVTVSGAPAATAAPTAAPAAPAQPEAAAAPEAAPAAQPAGGFVQFVLRGVNLRQGPSTGSKSLGQFKEGQVVAYTGVVQHNGRDWYQVEREGVSGYVLSTCVQVVNGSQPAATPAPAVTADPGLTAEGIDLPPNGAVTLIYAARVNEYAPLGEDEEGNAETIVNTAAVTGAGIARAVTASATVEADVTPDLTVAKSVCPGTVTENTRVTYTFVIANTGRETGEEDNVVLSDTFSPVLTDLTVTLNGQVLAEGTGYTYDGTTGEFATAEGVITVPGAVYTQNEESGVWTTEPGTVTLTISGYLGAVPDQPDEEEPPVERNERKK